MNKESAKPWAAKGSFSAEHEDFLIGNKEGLASLRESITAALEKGESQIESGSIEFVGVRVVEQDPRLALKRKEKPWAVLGCGLVVVFFLVTFFSGLYQIWSWLHE